MFFSGGTVPRHPLFYNRLGGLYQGEVAQAPTVGSDRQRDGIGIGEVCRVSEGRKSGPAGRLPTKIDTAEAERAELLRVGKPLGAKIKGLVTIVTPRTFQRWVEAEREGYSHNREVETKTKGDNQQLDEILLYYHSSRTQLSVDCNSPTPREMESPSLGKVVSIPQVGSLNDRYTRAA